MANTQTFNVGVIIATAKENAASYLGETFSENDKTRVLRALEARLSEIFTSLPPLADYQLCALVERWAERKQITAADMPLHRLVVGVLKNTIRQLDADYHGNYSADVNLTPFLSDVLTEMGPERDIKPPTISKQEERPALTTLSDSGKLSDKPEKVYPVVDSTWLYWTDMAKELKTASSKLVTFWKALVTQAEKQMISGETNYATVEISGKTFQMKLGKKPNTCGPQTWFIEPGALPSIYTAMVEKTRRNVATTIKDTSPTPAPIGYASDISRQFYTYWLKVEELSPKGEKPWSTIRSATEALEKIPPAEFQSACDTLAKSISPEDPRWELVKQMSGMQRNYHEHRHQATGAAK